MKSDVEQDYVDFVRHQANALCRTAYLLCGDWRRAEDATQEALIRLYRVWSRIQRKGSVGAYARKVVVSTTMDALRRKSSTEVVGGETYFAGEQERSDPLGVLENRLVITQALATLPPRQRACVVLRYFDEMSVEVPPWPSTVVPEQSRARPCGRSKSCARIPRWLISPNSPG
ncbi:sigma-70 family RNA polymerase sigma factor [Kribbella antibiotica]|uniref:Sigma-70 family RNA polymerase sigma factor n=1 Tax=Kribbella antibiotica TaxID=190195 RepID=A0A4R4Z7S8_9ACTN|nr:sigma-70 family RNA polymerase sigma factor [Kribbella antibiotica]TDD53204.1 sigma-70 family RNA polymerase sigma factor [Kribbella antibiotica]